MYWRDDVEGANDKEVAHEKTWSVRIEGRKIERRREQKIVRYVYVLVA